MITAGGETDVYRDANGTWTWEFEPNRATRADAGPLALPSAPDLLPSTLARRLLSEADPVELSRIGAERLAGRDALGIRVVPADAASSIDRVDVWVDAATGLPLGVQLFAKGTDQAALDTRYLDVELETPSASVTTFAPPDGATVRRGDTLRVLRNAAQDLSPVALPDTLAGLPRRALEGAPPTVGLYGRGVTLLAVVPVPGRLGRDLDRAAEQNPGAVRDEIGTRFTAGPLAILLVGGQGRAAYVLTGTVTTEALAQAAGELPELGGRP